MKMTQFLKNSPSTKNPEWVTMVALATENVKNGIDSDIIDDSPDDWFELESTFDLDAEGVYDNDDTDDAFVCMTCTGDPFDKQHNAADTNPHHGVLSDPDIVLSFHPNSFNDTINDSHG